jgi:hypothetical protein
MYEITVALWFIHPYILIVIALCLVLLTVYFWFQPNQYSRGHHDGYRKGKRAGERQGHAKGLIIGRAEGRAEGEAAGRQSEYLEHQNFVQCPEDGCDKAIHVPCHIIIEGEPGNQEIRAEVDQTELVMHMYEHTGQLPPQSPDVPHEGGHQ